jgi:hypothetical protein
MSMRVYYLDCHKAGLYCYLVIHVKKLVMSITAVLLQFVAYLLTPSYIHGVVLNVVNNFISNHF